MYERANFVHLGFDPVAAPVAVTAAPGTAAGRWESMPADGRAVGMFLLVNITVATDLVEAEVAIIRNGTNVGKVTIPDAIAAGERHYLEAEELPGQSLDFSKGDLIELEILTTGTDSGAAAGQFRGTGTVLFENSNFP